MWEKRNGEWVEYKEVDGSALYQTGGVNEVYRGKGSTSDSGFPSTIGSPMTGNGR